VTEQEIFTKNLILSTEFDRYIIEHPEFAAKIPLNAQVVFLPEDDEEFCGVNMEMAEKQRDEGQQVVYVHIGGVSPQLSRLTKVSLELKVA
jgi:hypothetical protein